MRRLNRPAAQVFLQHGVRAATDVTGFGLLGHAAEMVRASRQDGLTPVRFALQADALPALDGALEAARRGVETAGAAHNRRAVADLLEVADGVTPERVVLAFDPQTSGGLLAAVPPEELAAVEDDLAAAGVTAWEVGRVEEGFGLILC
jgi:selenide,water dikinase